MPVGDQSYLLTIAVLLRAGMLDPELNPIADYVPPARPQEMPLGWRRLWGRLRVR